MRDFRSLILLSFILASVYSCKKDNPALTATPLIMNVGADAGTSKINITSNTDWTITDDADWITVNPASGNGNGTVVVTFLKNSTTNALTSSVTITGAGIDPVIVTVNQSAANGPSVAVSWSRKADIPVARGFLSPSAGVVNGKIYVTGGTSADGILNTVEEYDPASDSWSEKSPLLAQRWGHSTDVVDGKIYVMGGSGDASGEALASIEVYDPGLDKWENIGNMQTPRLGFGSCVVNNKIYVVGGRTKEPSGDFLTSVEVYDPAANTWETKSALPKARGYLTATATSEYIYAMGGVGPDDIFPVGNIYKYDISADTWAQISSMPYERWGIVSCLVDDMIVCIGGSSGPTDTGQSTVGIIFTQDDDFVTTTGMSFGRFCSSVCVLNGKIYVFGGNISPVPTYLPSAYTEEGVVTLE